MTLTTSDLIGISGVAATILAALIAWLVSAWATKRSLAKQAIGYRMIMSPLLTIDKVPGGSAALKIEFNGEQLVEPTLLSVDIVNLGNRALENPPIVIEAVGATYVIPIYIESVPLGYEDLWSLERTDAEKCAVRLEHINPGQVVKARFFLDEVPSQMPVFKCAMKDVSVTAMTSVNIGPVAEKLLEVISPIAYSTLKAFTK